MTHAARGADVDFSRSPSAPRRPLISLAAPPRIAVDLRALVSQPPTGIGVYTRALLLELARRPSFRYLGLAHRLPPCAEELGAAGIPCEAQIAPLGVVWQQLRLPARLAAGDVDLFWSPLTTLPLRLPIPAVVTIPDLTTLLLPETHRLKVRLSVLPFLRRTLDRAARIVAISEATASDLARHFPECAPRVRVVTCGVEPEFAPGDPAAVAATRERLGLPEGYVLYAGTLEPRKNLGPLLDAWETLRHEHPESTPPLVLAGPFGWHGEGLRRDIARLQPLGLRVTGHVERAELVRLFQAARLFVYPSLYEGFGLPAAEALACGLPTIVSTSSSLPEVVGDAGVLVDPDDVGGLASAMRELLESPARAHELGARALERSRRFTWPRAADQLEEVFREALAAPGLETAPRAESAIAADSA